MDYAGHYRINSIFSFRNSDGSWSLYDNDRFEDSTPFHEQAIVLNGIDEEKDAGFRIVSFDFYTGGWEFDHIDISLFDFGHAELGFEYDDNNFAFSAFASVWSPSVSFEIFGKKIELSFEVVAVGTKFVFGKNKLEGKFGNFLGFGINITW